jgi:hypothetical protein
MPSVIRTETFESPTPIDLDLRLREADVEVVASDEPHVRVVLAHADGDGDAASVWDAHVTFSGAKLVLRAARHAPRLAVTVEAPSGSRLRARAHRGAIAVRGSLAELTAATGDGAVTAEIVDGPADVGSGRGDVRLGRVAGRLRARLGAGDADVASVGADATIATGSGDVRLGAVEADIRVRTGRGSIVIGDVGRGSLSLATAAGDVRVGIRPGSCAELDLVAGRGETCSELEVGDRPDGRTADVRVQARTGAGDVIVVRA